MDVEVPVLAGYLNVPTQSGFSLNRISKKKPCQRYCLLFKSSRHGIERLEICESKEDKSPKIITLENCVKITQEPAPANLIHIVKKTGTLTLNALTDSDLKEWVTALQTVAFRDKNSQQGSQLAIEEDNDLYCSSFGDGLFIITLIPSETSIRCNIEPKAYMLHLTATELQLKSVEEPNGIIAKWPYRFIRKYGYREGKFTFEAGRKCSTGEGVFTLDHSNPQEIFRCMSAKMKSMKKLISGDNINSIECGENQLSIAASMEAGSRSPLPPSNLSQHNEFEMNSTQSSMSLRGFISSSDSVPNFAIPFNSSNNSVPASLKNIPNKPPRKLPTNLDKIVTNPPIALHQNATANVDTKPILLNSEQFKKFQNYEPVSITSSKDPNKSVGSTVILKPPSPESGKKSNILPTLPVRNESTKPSAERDYESIETITDAWKTLGMNEVKHTERLASSNNDDDLIDFWQPLLQREKAHLKDTLPATVKTPKIIDIDIGEGGNNNNSGNGTGSGCGLNSDVNYDRLDFLAPNNKASSGYKTVVTVSSTGNRNRTSPPPSNDYELIASPDIQPCRKADDSHLGYGVLRKSSTNLAKSSSNSNNTPQNEIIVNLPKPSAKTSDSTTSLEHRSYNGLNYTIVSKPKRV